MIRGDEVFINGDGETTRDFCFVANAVQANLLAALADDEQRDRVYNVAVGQSTSLNHLFDSLVTELAANGAHYAGKPAYRDFREGDIRHSLADITRAQTRLGFAPTHTLADGLREAMPWYLQFIAQRGEA